MIYYCYKSISLLSINLILLSIILVNKSIAPFSCRDNVMTDLMKETDDIASKRKAYAEMRDLLQKAVEIVNEVINALLS